MSGLLGLLIIENVRDIFAKKGEQLAIKDSGMLHRKEANAGRLGRRWPNMVRNGHRTACFLRHGKKSPGNTKHKAPTKGDVPTVSISAQYQQEPWSC